MIAASRQSWAFSRDGALPFANFFRHVSKRIRFQPVRMIWGVATIALILGLLCLINSNAAQALFSLAVAGNDFAWLMPIFCRLVWGGDKFRPGGFYTGRLSKPIAVTAIVYLTFTIILSMFPTSGPNPTRRSLVSFPVIFISLFICFPFPYYALRPSRRLGSYTKTDVMTAQSMNYTIVINGTVWFGSLLYYLFFARKWFNGPKSTVGESLSDSSQSQLDVK
jgi:amino acid transporter